MNQLIHIEEHSFLKYLKKDWWMGLLIFLPKLANNEVSFLGSFIIGGSGFLVLESIRYLIHVKEVKPMHFIGGIILIFSSVLSWVELLTSNPATIGDGKFLGLIFLGITGFILGLMLFKKMLRGTHEDS